MLSFFFLITGSLGQCLLWAFKQHWSFFPESICIKQKSEKRTESAKIVHLSKPATYSSKLISSPSSSGAHQFKDVTL